METACTPRKVRLRDGREVLLREARPTDEEELLQAFDRMSPEARYMRFMSSIRHANVDRLRAVLASLPGAGCVVVATVAAPDGIDIVGASSFMLLPDGRSCEFAISVSGSWNGAGLGRVLLEEIVALARRRGLDTMKGYILSTNTPMLRLAARVGFESHRDPDDATVRIATLPLARPGKVA